MSAANAYVFSQSKETNTILRHRAIRFFFNDVLPTYLDNWTGCEHWKKGKVYFPANRQLPNLVGEDLTNKDNGLLRNRHQHIGTALWSWCAGRVSTTAAISFFCSGSLFPTGWTTRVGYVYLMYPMDLSDPL